jgi:hypothetical protein
MFFRIFKKRFLYTLFFILNLAFISCKKKANGPGQFNVNDFKKVQELNGRPLSLAKLHRGMDLTIIPEKKLLLIIDVDDSDYVKAYDLSTFKFIKSFIKKGSGPNEQIDCHKLQYDNKGQYLFAVDRGKNKIFIYSIGDILDPTKAVSPKSDIMLNNNALFKPLLLPSGKFVDLSVPKTKQKSPIFNFYNADGDSLYQKGRFPSLEQDYNPMELRTAFEGQFFSSADGGHIVLSYYNSDYIDVYDSLGNLQHRVHGPDIFDPAVRTMSKFGGKMIINDQGSHFAYTSPKMKDDSLLVLYQGLDGPVGPYHENKLFLFNQKLEPKVLFKLTQPIFLFDIDWKTKTLYALSHQVKGSNLIVIKLP